MKKTPEILFEFIAKATLNQLLFGVGGDLILEVIPAVAKDLFEGWRNQRSPVEMQADLESVVQADAQEIRRLAGKVVQEVAGDQPLAIQQSLELYLNQVPSVMRRSLARPEDPFGTTVPLELIPNKAEDLMRLLPHKLPRFKVGDMPVGVGSWQLQELLGVGGFGEVWRACNPDFPEIHTALKFCYDDGARQVLENEANLLYRVMQQGHHPGIVQLKQIHLRAETPCLEYEYIPGGELTGLIQNWHRQGRPTPEQTVRVIRRLAEIVAFAHGLNPPIVHRDLKPANILVYRAEGETQFKITDFGIGGLSAQQVIRETQQGISTGTLLASCVRGAHTPLYASPQQQRGADADPRDDVYALGVIWYHLLTGDLSSGAPAGRRWETDLKKMGMSDPLIDILASCWEPKPENRPNYAGVLEAQLLQSGSVRTRKSLLKSENPKMNVSYPVQREDRDERPHHLQYGFAQTSTVSQYQRDLLQKLSNFVEDLGKKGGLLGRNISLEMIYIPGGSFDMGSLDSEGLDNEHPQHRVTVPAFYLSKYPVTQAQYHAVVDTNPSHFKGGNLPVECVSWDDAMAFCQKLTKKTGKIYRLPSEAEWEYACRAGTTTPYSFKDDENYLGNYAWHNINSDSTTHPVGEKQPNPWGLYDMHGNVWEWCLDHWHPNYDGAPTDGSAWLNKNDNHSRQLRGGCWSYASQHCRSGYRFSFTRNYRLNDIGFRICCVASRLSS